MFTFACVADFSGACSSFICFSLLFIVGYVHLISDCRILYMYGLLFVFLFVHYRWTFVCAYWC